MSKILTLYVLLLCLLVSVTVNIVTPARHRDEMQTLKNTHQAKTDALKTKLDGLAELQKQHDELLKYTSRLATLDPTAFLASPIDPADLIHMVPTGNPFHQKWYLTSRFGADKGYSGNPRVNHTGTDMVPYAGDRGIYPIGDGIVEDIGIDLHYGKYVTVQHNDYVRTVYAHLETIFYSALPGEVITVKTAIGVMGMTGNADAPHLHIEVQVYNGKVWLPIDGYSFMATAF